VQCFPTTKDKQYPYQQAGNKPQKKPFHRSDLAGIKIKNNLISNAGIDQFLVKYLNWHKGAKAQWQKGTKA
jgi:hypothetical protein